MPSLQHCSVQLGELLQACMEGESQGQHLGGTQGRGEAGAAAWADSRMAR